VFDTLLMRKVAVPTSLFLIVGDRAACSGLWQSTAEDFRKKRIEAEAKARAGTSSREVTLREIYRELSEKSDLALEKSDALARLEMEVEAESLVQVPGSRDMVESARVSSNKILFVSDMYLPPEFIREQLATHGFWRDGDELYVSGEYKCSKADGLLFMTALKREDLRPAALLHTGDRRDSDYEVPSRLGIKARHLDRCFLNRYEQMLEEFSTDSGGLSSQLAGISRLVRLEHSTQTKHLTTLTEIASSLVSPVIVFYTLWVLKEAKDRGLSKLYFVARDGYLIKRIADSLIRALNFPIETRYLYGSRQAWHLPAITDFLSEDLSWLFERTRTLNIQILIGRLQMNPEDIEDILTQLGWPRSVWLRPLDDNLLAKLKEDLLSSAEFRVEVERLVSVRRNIALQYFKQEGLFDENPCAIIDLGWHGRLQQSLERLIGSKRANGIVGLYFGLYADSPALSRQSTASYLNWDLRKPPDSKDIPSLVFLMESFCTAPHGSTVGYRRSANGLIVPEFRDSNFKPLKTWGINTVHAVVEKYAERFGELTLSEKIIKWDSRPALIRILGTFSRNPLAAEARAWGAFPYEDEQSGAVRERLTVPYALTWDNLRIAFTFGDRRLLPASWNVLWHGAQEHLLSVNSVVLGFALRVGLAKRNIGAFVRRIFGVSVN
jgi:predicted HAD superfamily hydrolase